MGFQTFPEMFDESYDEISNNVERANFILDEVERVCNMDTEELHKIYVSLLPKIKHNHKLMKNILKILETKMLIFLKLELQKEMVLQVFSYSW